MQVDELVLKLIMDNSQFEKGQRQASESFKKTKEDLARHGKDIETAAKGMGLALSAVAEAAASVLAAFLSLKAIEGITSKIVDFDSATGRTAKTLGMSAQELAAWDAIARQAGGTTGEAAGALQSFADSFSQLQISGKSAALEPLFRSVGLAGKEAENIDISKGPMAALSAFAHNIQVIARTNPALAHSLGISVLHSEALVQQFMAGGAQLDKLLAAQSEFNHLTKEDVEAAQQRVVWWNKFSDALFDSFRRVNTYGLTPLIIGAEKVAIKFLEWNQQLEAFNSKIVKGGISFFDNFVRPLVEGIEAMADKIGVAFKHAFGAALNWLKGEILSITGGLSNLFGIGPAHASAGPAAAGGGATPKTNWLGKSLGMGGAIDTGSSPVATTEEGKKRAALWMSFLTGDKDLHLSREQAAGIVGNLSHESGGFTQYHEVGQPWNRGGVGDAQWTGTRRLEFESWAASQGLNPRSFEAQSAFMKRELLGKERRSLDAIRAAKTPGEAASIFEQTNERAGVAAIGSRVRRANDIFSSTPRVPNVPPVTPGTSINNGGSSVNSNNTTSTSQTSFNGGITVNTNSNNGMQIARDIQDTLRRTAYGAQANYSLA